MKCRFIDTGFNDAFTNMAIDEALLSECKIPTLRVYSWIPKSVSVGYNQDINKEVNLVYCRENNINIVRRITGGKAVLHDKEITYSFIVPENANLLPIEINDSYRVIAKALITALKKLNINAEIKKIPERIKTPICFNSSNWYELLVNKKKISGSAQRRIDGKVIQHGPVLIDFDYKQNYSVFKTDNKFDTLENLQLRITSLNRELKTSKNLNSIYLDLKAAIKIGFKDNFNLEMFNDSLTSMEVGLSEKLIKEKYSTEEWNYQILTKTI
jgi:lipoyl(octanoyl) transferase